MKSFIQALAIAAVLAVPAVSFAQSNAPVTRAEVRAQLIQLEKAGYNPSDADNANYPADIQKAEARVASENGAANGYGGVANGSSASGAGAAVLPANTGNTKSIYFGH
jgi:Domain of unknown function (DUF4148)